MLTDQAIFDKAINHLRKQGERALRSEGGGKCAYRGVNGTMCAVGVLIDDKHYDPKCENRAIGAAVRGGKSLTAQGDNALVSSLLASGVNPRPPHTRELLEALQHLHDSEMVEGWTAGCEKFAMNIAFDHDLIYTAPTQGQPA